MTARPVASELSPRPSARVKRVAEILDADQAIVRRLVRDGQIESHTIGKRGVRIYLDSVADYQARQGRRITPLQRERRQVSRAAAREAIARLKQIGIL